MNQFNRNIAQSKSFVVVVQYRFFTQFTLIRTCRYCSNLICSDTHIWLWRGVGGGGGRIDWRGYSTISRLFRQLHFLVGGMWSSRGSYNWQRHLASALWSRFMGGMCAPTHSLRDWAIWFCQGQLNSSRWTLVARPKYCYIYFFITL